MLKYWILLKYFPIVLFYTNFSIFSSLQLWVIRFFLRASKTFCFTIFWENFMAFSSFRFYFRMLKYFLSKYYFYFNSANDFINKVSFFCSFSSWLKDFQSLKNLIWSLIFISGSFFYRKWYKMISFDSSISFYCCANEWYSSHLR